MREEGYYWVKLPQDGWMIAYWDAEYWQIRPFSENKWSDDLFLEIDERRITRRDIDAENKLHELNPKEEREKMEGLGNKLFGLI